MTDSASEAPAADWLLGVDLGGTKIEVALLDAEGTFQLRERLPTPRGNYGATLETIAALVERADAHAAAAGRGPRPLPLGMAIPGAVSALTGRIKNANSLALNGQDLQQDLEQRLQRPVRLQNDANCLAVSEAVDGAGAGVAMVLGVILGTGSGAGIAIDGRAWRGCNSVGGEWGHNPLPWLRAEWGEWPGPACWCGQSGCIEAWVSGPGWAAAHLRETGHACSTEQIVAAMRAGDAQAREGFERQADRLARALAHVINLLDPEVIVLGGGLSNVSELYEAVPARWGAYVFSDAVQTALRPARHGDSSGVRGAAWLWRP
ncbi:ROK family protein [Sphaerotilus microaerophilus]|uniref:N-acetylglucosamine kinase n=1 Tax=Sphaerotilus microaerophilus TaxID=2914710 RepID=A0ABM7YMN9_9BURK|nr:ROK family protein [Sphaerotilus sp. FB-5]BDI05686.1 N-acetylglucosamine kinase [Sphaerotilus sp. FB-5]